MKGRVVEGEGCCRTLCGRRTGARTYLQRHQVQACDGFRDGVLHLQAGVGLDEPKLVFPHEKFDSAEGGEGGVG